MERKWSGTKNSHKNDVRSWEKLIKSIEDREFVGSDISPWNDHSFSIVIGSVFSLWSSLRVGLKYTYITECCLFPNHLLYD